MTKILKNNSKKRIDEERNTYYKNNRSHAIGGLLTTNALTATTAAFADSNALS